jgi:uncharacterized membrane protein
LNRSDVPAFPVCRSDAEAAMVELFRGTERDIGRMEAFSDGVFAIAITLLIIDIRVPTPNGGEPFDLKAALMDLWPSYFAFVFSFVVIGIYWLNHHFMGKIYTRADHGLLLCNLFFLLGITFLPFPTRVLAEHLTDQAHRADAAAFYTLGLLFRAGGWLLKWLYAVHARRLMRPGLDGNFLRRLTIQYAATFFVYLAAALLTRVDYRLGLGLAIGLTLLYLLPPPRPVYVQQPGARDSKPARA